jgi:hypothetical protein
MSLAVPIEQFRFDYDVLTPDGYDENYLSITAHESSAVLIDGSDVGDQLQALSTSPYRTGHILVEPGQHRIECSDGCGVELYGWSDAVSYLLAGGLDLAPIYVP